MVWGEYVYVMLNESEEKVGFLLLSLVFAYLLANPTTFLAECLLCCAHLPSGEVFAPLLLDEDERVGVMQSESLARLVSLVAAPVHMFFGVSLHETSFQTVRQIP